MNIVRVYYFLFLSLFLFSCNGNAQNNSQADKKEQVSNHIEILDFHTKHRCKACISIEANTKLTIEKYFKNELDSGKLSFRLINADAEENEKIVEEYEAYGTSLFINVVKNGKQKHIDITNFAFKTEANKDKFISELKAKIENELNKI